MLKLLKKQPKLNRDYEMHNLEDDRTAVRILTGKFKGVIYLYGMVSPRIMEDQCTLSFSYEIIEGKQNGFDYDSDEKFVKLIGTILEEILSDSETAFSDDI